MSSTRDTPSDAAENPLDRPRDAQLNVIDYVLTGPSLENVPIERERSPMREPECHGDEEDLFTAIRRIVGPMGGFDIPEHPDKPIEPPDFSRKEFDWPDTEEGREALAERLRRLFRREDDDA